MWRGLLLWGFAGGGGSDYANLIEDWNTRVREYLRQLYGYSATGAEDLNTLIERWFADVAQGLLVTPREQGNLWEQLDTDSLTK